MMRRIRNQLFVFLGITSVAVLRVAAANAGDSIVHLSPGRVQFTMKSDGEWTGFGVRGERPLLEHGGIVVYAGRAGSTLLDERASSAHGGMRGIKMTNEMLFEGMRGGARYPSIQPDDDNDGRVDEDPWDRVDNDGDGQVDEDFAAIGDEMAVALYGTRGDAALVVREECYAWSLPNIDGMVASTIVVTNDGARAVPHAHLGVVLETASGLEVGDTPVIENRSTSALDAALAEKQVVFDDDDRGLGVLMLIPRAQMTGDAGGWQLQDDHSRVVAVSPDLGDLAPGASVTMYLALVALPADDLKAVHAIRNAHRTIVGDGTTRFIPPPISVMARNENETAAADRGATPAREGGSDLFWITPGKLQETLLVGSPNPFRDTMSIDFEIPHRVVDEDGAEHVLDGPSQPTSVKIYNVAGRLVATLLDEPRSPGRYRVDWTARGEDGTSLASGVYYVKLQIGKRSVTMRMVQLK
jgi:FlgD Ig-like domain